MICYDSKPNECFHRRNKVASRIIQNNINYPFYWIVFLFPTSSEAHPGTVEKSLNDEVEKDLILNKNIFLHISSFLLQYLCKKEAAIFFTISYQNIYYTGKTSKNIIQYLAIISFS